MLSRRASRQSTGSYYETGGEPKGGGADTPIRGHAAVEQQVQAPYIQGMSLQRLAELRDRLIAITRTVDASQPPAPPDGDTVASGSRLRVKEARQLVESQIVSRHLDRIAYELRGRGEGFYTIAGAGHEGNVVLGRLLRTTDPALLHYRSGALFVERARQCPHVDAVESIVLGLTASSEEPIAGGRHKVFGSIPLGVLPQTSTVASHVPKAVGLAFSLERAWKLGLPPRLPGNRVPPRDAVVLCSFGDASLNHASATAGFNAARWVRYQGLPLPVLFMCEDNELGISVRTPPGWVESVLARMPDVPYFQADTTDLAQSYEIAARAVQHCRTRRVPVFLHLRCVRLLGHSGADPDAVYRSARELEQAATRDPVYTNAHMLLERGICTSAELKRMDAQAAEHVERAAYEATQRPKLQSAEEIMTSLAPSSPHAVRREAERSDYRQARLRCFGDDARLPEHQSPQPMGRLLSWALHDLLCKDAGALVFGEDVARKGGVYNVTARLWKHFGGGRVFNTLLDETTILGLAQGAALAGLLPVPEIQYLAFFHNAEDQLRGEAASTAFFSRGQVRAPMVLRVAGLGYQKGFGGHFHNDASLAVFRDIPGLVLGVPSNGHDAVGMLRTCAAAARVDGRVCVLVEPIALYAQRDLYEEGDELWLRAFPAPGQAVPLGAARVHDAGGTGDLTIATYGNGVRMALRVARRLQQERNTRTRVVDLRWLAPLPADTVAAHARETGALLIFDECRRPGNVGEALATRLACDDGCRHVRIRLVTARDSFVPLGDAAELVLASESELWERALELLSAR